MKYTLFFKLTVIFSLLCVNYGIAQVQLFKPIDLKKSSAADHNMIELELSQSVFQSLKKSKSTSIKIALPFGQDLVKNVVVREVFLFDKDAIIKIRHADHDELIDPSYLKFYTGTIEGEKSSLVALTISEDEIIGVISYQGISWNLEANPDKSKKSSYFFYPEQQNVNHQLDCLDTDFEELQPTVIETYDPRQTKSSNSQMMSTVDLYIECDHIMYQSFNNNNGSVISYTAGLLNTVNSIYNMSNIHLNVTQIEVWATPDPYDAANAESSVELLNKFKCQLDGNYNGRIAHLLSTVNQFGGIANRRSSCPYDKPLYAFSRIFTSYDTNLSNYSWSVNVIAHEVGHNLSSKHTHACVWYGNDTQIDDCANMLSVTNNKDTDCDDVIDNVEEAEGSDCLNPNNPILPVSPAKGTVMSYCHAYGGIGIDLSQGFHPEVTNKMKNFIDNCLTTDVTVHCSIVQPSEISILELGPNELQLTCSRITGVDNYAWNFVVNEDCYDRFTIVTSNNSVIVNNVLSNKEYEIICVLNCDTSTVWGDWSCPVYYTMQPCIANKSLSGPYSSEIKYEDAYNQIDSWEMIQDTSEVHYYYGNQTILHPGFSVEKESLLVIDTTTCL